MTELQITDLLRDFLWLGVWIASPLLITALVVGIVIGLFQALTSVQELTLTFVPKLIAMLIAFTWSLSFSAQNLLAAFEKSVMTYIAQ